MTDSTRKCYYPSGVWAPGDVPCSGEEYTSCCNSGSICLSNGLCLNVATQPFALSRGSCTNQKWDQGCPEYCSDVYPDGGCSIINVSYKDKVSKYCCGLITNGDSAPTCTTGEEFAVPSAEALPGYALLANVSSFDADSSGLPTNCTALENTTNLTNTTCSTLENVDCPGCHETAIGAGVGVSLGVIALASLVWALFERRRARQASKTLSTASSAGIALSASPAVYDSGVYATYRKTGTAELDSQRPAAELNGSAPYVSS
ncbi:hypothetical protein BJX61DRAFT_366835 [Aspergillus egyptiacus]|nr:hypothetical protein BJX61DRAFT_366835 [Aspergillus egyptiacus]